MATITKAFNTRLHSIGYGAMNLVPDFLYRGDIDVKGTLDELVSVQGRKVLVDTSAAYGDGLNERQLAPYLQSHRDRIFICTRFGKARPNAVTGGDLDSSPDAIKASCNLSLKNLGVDSIDIFLQHRVDPNVPIEETVSTLKELKAAGKIKNFGLGECSAETLKRALAVSSIDAIEWEYSPTTTEMNSNGLIDLCRENNVVLIAYAPMCRGLFAKDWKTPQDIPKGDVRKNLPRFNGQGFAQNMKLVEKFKYLADSKGCTVGQLALAWNVAECQSRGVTSIPIAGTSKPHYLKTNLEAAGVVISKGELSTLRKYVQEANIQGDRYHAAGMKIVNS